MIHANRANHQSARTSNANTTFPKKRKSIFPRLEPLLRRPKRARDDSLGFFQNLIAVRVADEALGVDLVQVFRSTRAGGEPRVLGHDFQTANRCVVGGRSSQFGGDRLPCQSGRRDQLWRHLAEDAFLRRCRGCVNALVEALAEFGL
jgi:hypothetical protein